MKRFFLMVLMPALSSALWPVLWLAAAKPAFSEPPLQPLHDTAISDDAVANHVRKLVLTNACEGCYLVGANLEGAHLIGADLRGANLTGANLSNTNLEGADLTAANLTDANLTGAFATNAVMDQAQLVGVNFSSATLYYVQIGGAQIQNINLTSAQVLNTPLSIGGPDLGEPNFNGLELNQPAAAPVIVEPLYREDFPDYLPVLEAGDLMKLPLPSTVHPES